ncbi:hypothetical protein EI94DRAFT_1753083, partial [Lactarius quietus]
MFSNPDPQTSPPPQVQAQSHAAARAPLTSGPYRWRGIALLPLRNGGGAWQDVGDRLRDLRAVRGTYLRLELSLAPLKSRGAAQLSLTGDVEFVRTARLAAARHGMHLDEYGLWRWHDDSPESNNASDDDHDDEGGGYWELVEGENEIRILDEIGIGNVPPSRRNFRFLVAGSAASESFFESELAEGVDDPVVVGDDDAGPLEDLF